MSTILLWVAVGVTVILVILLAVALFASSGEGQKQPAPTADVSINAAEGSIVTVRKVGRTTRVVIRSDIHDHWEGSDGIDISPAPIELTRQEEPELYEEYMSSKTSAIRKYEIADYIYSLGLTLPYIHGLHEQWQKENEKASSELNPALEHTPANPKGGKMKEGIVYNKLDINHKLRQEPLVDMDPGPVDDPPQSNEQNETDT